MSISTRQRPDSRALIVDDHVLYAELLSLVLSGRGIETRCLFPRPDMSSVHLVSAILARSVAVVLLDLDLGDGLNGISLIEPLTAQGARVVVVTASAEPDLVGECLVRGARTVLQKTGSLEEVVSTVRKVEGGQPELELEDRRLLELAAERDGWVMREQTLLTRLSRREAAILKMLMGGSTVEDVARRDIVSVATVRTQVKAILGKLGVSSQLAAVAIAYRACWSPTV